MTINPRALLSYKAAVDDFSLAASLADQIGYAVIIQNDVPRYIITVFDDDKQTQTAEDGKTMRTAMRLINKYRRAFEKL